MALTGIEIFKMLPKTNCKECGFPTCLAFAMALASGKAELDKCPYVSDEAKEKLAAASAPPIRPVKLAMKDGVKTIGGETVMFRHEKTFFNPTIIAGVVTTAACRRRGGQEAGSIHEIAVRPGGSPAPSGNDGCI